MRKKLLIEEDQTLLVKDNEGVTILIAEMKWLDCRTKRKKNNLMKEKGELARLVNMMLLLKKTYNYSMRFRC
jgi:hypothetical protein